MTLRQVQQFVAGLATCALEVREDEGAWQPYSQVCAGTDTYAAQPGHTYTFRLSATDNVGNEAQAEAGAFTTDEQLTHTCGYVTILYTAGQEKRMSETIVTVYERGVLRPLTPLALPENTQVRIQIVAPILIAQEERLRVRKVLLDAGVIRPRQVTEPVQPVSEAELEEAARTLAKAGPLSELVIAEREGR